jgi:hypothetical protein
MGAILNCIPGGERVAEYRTSPRICHRNVALTDPAGDHRLRLLKNPM